MSTSPVTVLYCESNVDGTIGGSHYCLLNLVSALDRTRFTPMVAFYEAHALVERFHAVSETVILPSDSPVQWGAHGGGGALTLPVAGLRRAVNAVKLLRKIAANVAFIKRRGIRLVHLNNSITGHHDWMWAAKLARVPCVVHERGLPQYGPSERSWSHELALVIPMSAAIGNKMIAQGIDRDVVRVMYDGLDPARLLVAKNPEAIRAELGLLPHQEIVGIVGNIRQWKGQETVVRALRRVAQTHPDVVCLFVGATTARDEPFLHHLQGLVREMNLESNVRFCGYRSDVPSVVNLMRFVIHASVVPEPFGMVVLEAMALRKAVVGARAGGVVEMVRDGQTGFTFAPGDVDELAARMLDLLANPGRTVDMGERGYDRLVAHFSLKHFAEDVQCAYDEILSGRSVTSGLSLDGQLDAGPGPD